MAIVMPWWAQPLLDFYNLRWPDIDEDAVAELGAHIEVVARDITEFSRAVHRCLEELTQGTESLALQALADDFEIFANGTISSTADVVANGATTACSTAAGVITAYKGGLVAYLGFNLATDIAALSTGAGAALVVAKKAMLREVLSNALEEFARQTAAWVVNQWNDAVDSMLLGPLEDLATEVGSQLGGSLRQIAVMSVPTDAFAVGGARLYIDHDDVVDAVAHVGRTFDALRKSVKVLQAWNKGHGYSTPTPVPDPTVRVELKQALDWAMDAFVDQIEMIGSDIIHKIADSILEIYNKYVAADTSLQAIASDLKAQYKFPPPPQVFHIDRSSRPKPIEILDAAPPIITGEATSDARFNIRLIDLPDVPDPVVTGAGESDARFDISVIDLPDMPASGDSSTHSNAGTGP